MSSGHVKDGRPRRQRLLREERHRQLLDVAWRIAREDGTEALTLGRLAEQAAVTKPVVYDHFPTRPALFAALYQEFDEHQNMVIDAALAVSEPTLEGRARVIASSYVDCVLEQGREIPGVVAALVGTPELATMKREHEAAFLEKCRTALAPFARGLTTARLCGMLGAAAGLSAAAASGEITTKDASEELYQVILAVVARSAG
ncbi:TetR/AcrR family transcriptional regulator [Mesorhizobium retamae]|uniref:TetR/AcrR family transcriptional regulator n=1 Tax=Mesorhizobium retamae TaxID=2912854 RepID=A0ABS9QKM8_9HYPH|nr:TetR/AcrR family transcriptional regulator [Mesorhizobium sp. IRAMC:0171]MCG7507291.1 TetR/AcrR family transcriptional regulator [Mesorhizobium sp. IRAMC:0171]